MLEDLCLDMGTSVASALTAETIFESMKCMSDVDMRSRVRNCAWGQKPKFSGFSILATPTIEIFRFLDVEHRHSAATENTTIKPNYASVRQSRYALHRGTHKLTKQESPAVADKPARRLRKVCTVYVGAWGCCKLYS